MFESMMEKLIKESDRLHDIKTATIEDLKQNPHVQGLLETIRCYADKNKWEEICLDYGTVFDKQEGDPIQCFNDDGEGGGYLKARAKLKEWE